MPRFGGEFGGHRFSFERRETVEPKGFREKSFEDSISSGLPDRVAISPHIGIIFKEVALANPVKRKERFGANVPVSVYKAQFVAFDHEFDFHIDNASAIRTLDIDVKAITGKDVLFTGSANGCYAYDPSMMDPNHESFFMIGFDPHETTVSPAEGLLAVIHELGHLKVYQQNEDVLLGQAAVKGKVSKAIKKRRQGEKYARTMRGAVETAKKRADQTGVEAPTFDSRKERFLMQMIHPEVDYAESLFNERMAWAEGLQILRSHAAFRDEVHFLLEDDRNKRTEKQQSQAPHYISRRVDAALQTYTDHFATVREIEPKGADRFVTGWMTRRMKQALRELPADLI